MGPQPTGALRKELPSLLSAVSVRNCLRFFTVLLFISAVLWVYPQDNDFSARGDGAVAYRYALWAKNAIDQGKWSEALAALERATNTACPKPLKGLQKKRVRYTDVCEPGQMAEFVRV